MMLIVFFLVPIFEELKLKLVNEVCLAISLRTHIGFDETSVNKHKNKN